jgi:hypothetical protein
MKLNQRFFNVLTHEKFVKKPEDWKGSSFRHDQTGVRGAMEIESQWTARQRGWQLPEWMRDLHSGLSTTPVPKSEGPGPPSSE